MSDAARQVWLQLLQQISASKKPHDLKDEMLVALEELGVGPLVQALDLVDRAQVFRISCPAGRSLTQVVGSTGTPYTVTSYYCPCPAFRYSVLKRKEASMCKHMMASELAAAMGVEQHKSLADAEVAQILRDVDS